MKVILILAIFILFVGCAQSKFVHSDILYSKNEKADIKKLPSYKVYKIDSINSYYLIYAKKNESLFKIVSKKRQIADCNSIVIGGVYKFVIHSSLYINGHTLLSPEMRIEIGGVYYDDSTIITFEGDSIKDLYHADNIQGLCFIK